jgi:Major Facilitator Superfamily
MASREAQVVNVAGVVQGVALVTFPAASTIFTNPNDYGLTSTAYGAMFVPQAIAAISASLYGARWAGRVGTRRVYLVGLIANLTSMTLLVVSDVVMNEQTLAYGILLVATASLGVGFGFTVPALNTFAAAFNPAKADGSVLVLNALLGLGTALAPVLVAIFVGLGFWWGLPVMTGIALGLLTAVSVRLPFAVTPAATTGAPAAHSHVPARFFAYAAFAFGYGICETMNGNWASLDMTELGASTTEASLALTTFWGCVTLGRVGFAAIRRWLPTSRTYHLLPFVLAAALLLISQLPDGQPALGIAMFGLAGFGCSALLPLTISFGQEELLSMSTAVAGGIIAFYQLGYGIAAFGAGPVQTAGVDLSTLYGLSAFVAVALGALAFLITRHRPAPTGLHPKPAPHQDHPASARRAAIA